MVNRATLDRSPEGWMLTQEQHRCQLKLLHMQQLLRHCHFDMNRTRMWIGRHELEDIHVYRNSARAMSYIIENLGILLFVSALKMLNAKLLKFKFMEYVLPLSTVIVGLVPATAVPSFFQLKAPAVSSTLKSGTTAGAGGVYVFVIVRTVTLPAVSTEKPVL